MTQTTKVGRIYLPLNSFPAMGPVNTQMILAIVVERK